MLGSPSLLRLNVADNRHEFTPEDRKGIVTYSRQIIARKKSGGNSFWVQDKRLSMSFI
jgi:hypothetical protein